MKARFLIAAAATATLALAGAAKAATADKTDGKDATRSCFLTRDWEGWRGADANTIYLRVHAHDVYKVELSAGSNMVTDPTNHLINNVRGSSWICDPLDLDLKVSDGHIVMPLIVRSITKLTPEQVAMIPKKVLP
ncbi:MAG TPA: hypothetical protein VL358_04085 [Caulobacteraceae bacterium]|jgi:hypothetical protein|nr:hypothetical protein [Caulobacteraceae bacterium]